MDRPQIGSNPVLTEHDTESYLDFVEGLFSYLPRMSPAVAERANAELASYKEQTGRDPENVQEAHEVLDHLPIMQARNRLRRDMQEMKYKEIARDFIVNLSDASLNKFKGTQLVRDGKRCRLDRLLLPRVFVSVNKS